MTKVKIIGALVAVLLFVVVILQNTQSVETRFLFVTITMPNAALLGLTLLVGIGIGLVVALVVTAKREPKQRAQSGSR